MNTLIPLFKSLKHAQSLLVLEDGYKKNNALQAVSTVLDSSRSAILKANEEDLAKAKNSGMKSSLMDRLILNDARIDEIIHGIDDIILQENPVNKIKASWSLPNKLLVEQVTVPFGIAAVIYESRPNVTVDIFSLAYKAGCSVLLRGSSSALQSNRTIVSAIKSGLEMGGGIPSAIALADEGNEGEIDEILNARGWLDVIIPRGSRDLIRYVVDNARIPVIEIGEGNCHIYVEPSVNLENALDIIENAKIQKPGARNSIETLLIHKDIVSELMPLLVERFAGRVELRCDAFCKSAIVNPPENLVLKDATKEDWETEFLDYILAVKSVRDLEEAVAHINRYGTKHSEAILTEDMPAAEKFMKQVDAACVYTNTSTRFTDGCEFGFGAELGVSTQKFHARGPMGLAALTSIKYHIISPGLIRT